MTAFSHIRVRWLHSFADEPTDLLCELDAARNEIRKIEFWADGRCGYASETVEIGGTRLATLPCPSLQEINRDPQFRAREISPAAFEQRWQDATAQHHDSHPRPGRG